MWPAGPPFININGSAHVLLDTIHQYQWLSPSVLPGHNQQYDQLGPCLMLGTVHRYYWLSPCVLLETIC